MGLKYNQLIALFVFVFTLLGMSGCESAFDEKFDPRPDKTTPDSGSPVGTQKTNTWSFLNSADYTFDSSLISVSGNQASLKTVNTTFNDATTFNTGTYLGTTYAGGVLKLDTSTADNSLSSAWTPRWSSLVGYWKLDGNWLDSSGNTRHGAPGGSPSAAGTAKVGTNSASFNHATSDYVQAAGVGTAVGSSGEISVSFWVKTQTANASSDMLSFGAGQLRFETDGTTSGLAIVNSGLHATVNANYLKGSAWTHVAYSSNGSSVFLMINGVVVATPAITGTITLGSDLFLGAGSAASAFWKGSLDDVAVWKVGLSQAEMQTIYNRQKQKYSGIYDSPIIKMGSTNATWTSLTSVSSLPFLKDLPGSAGSETAAVYSALDTSSTLNTQLKALWSLSGTGTPADGAAVADSSGTGNNGSIVDPDASNTISYVTNGQLGSAMHFDGVNDYVNVSTMGTLGSQMSNGLTYAFWFRTTSSSIMAPLGFVNTNIKTAVIPSFNANAAGGASPGNCRYFLRNEAGTAANAQFDCSSTLDGGWHHMAISHNVPGGTTAAYLDGKAVALSSVTNSYGVYANLGFAMAVGALNGRGTIGNFFNGDLDEVAIWRRALSAAEVSQLYRRGANRVKYQVRSCVDASCACRAYNTAPVGSASDCDGDGVANDVDSSDTYAADWFGPSGSGTTYFSEQQNNTAVDASGNPTGTVNVASGLVLDWSTAFFTASARPVNNPYFQYRISLESDDTNNACSGSTCVPEVTSVVVAPTGRYYGGGAPIVNNASISFLALSTMSSVDPGSCVTYQLSIDGGTTYKWWNGAAWTNTTDGVATSNYLVDFTPAHLALLSAGDFKFKAFLNTNTGGGFSSACVLSQVGIDYTGY